MPIRNLFKVSKYKIESINVFLRLRFLCLSYSPLFCDGLVLWHEGRHDKPANEVGDCTVTEDDHVACRFACGSEKLEGIAKTVSIGEEHTRTFVDGKGTESAKHGADASNGGNGRFWEHIANGGVEVGTPCLMTSSCQTDDDARPPRGNLSEWLCKHGEDGKESKDKHGTHTTSIGVHAHFLDEEFG